MRAEGFFYNLDILYGFESWFLIRSALLPDWQEGREPKVLDLYAISDLSNAGSLSTNATYQPSWQLELTN